MTNETVWLVIGCKPTEKWPLVDDVFNAEPEAWTAFRDEDAARAKVEELNSSEEHVAQWKAVPRRLE